MFIVFKIQIINILENPQHKCIASIVLEHSKLGESENCLQHTPLFSKRGVWGPRESEMMLRAGQD